MGDSFNPLQFFFFSPCEDTRTQKHTGKSGAMLWVQSVDIKT